MNWYTQYHTTHFEPFQMTFAHSVGKFTHYPVLRLFLTFQQRVQIHKEVHEAHGGSP